MAGGLDHAGVSSAAGRYTENLCSCPHVFNSGASRTWENVFGLEISSCLEASRLVLLAAEGGNP